VYVREAHPTDEWQMKSNVKEDVCYAQPKSLEQRIVIANDFIKRFHYPLPFGVDEMSNSADSAYAAWPERIYIVGDDGRIAYRGGMGPFNYHPSEARAWLAARFGEVKHETAPPAPAEAPAPAPKS
jgi:type I thyroxine 5'-deiodinase